MKLKTILVTALLCLFSACSFKSKDANEMSDGGTPPANNEELKINPNADSDGDGLKDGEEVTQGRNPFVADLPDLKVRFLQNYKIEVTYHDKDSDPLTGQKSFVIDTMVKDTNPDFKFRVGNVFARNHALKTAASFGRFATHSSGTFEEHDLSWVSYPELDPKFFHAKAIEYRDVFNDRNVIDNIKITLSNQARLNESPIFKEIKNLKLNFYYLNHETENYEVLTSTQVDRHFQSGIYESFDVVIDQAPVSLLKESFFKRGEFIISEVEDYEIPTLSLNYKTLLSAVKAKSVPVLYETPLEEKIFYVSASEGVSFQNILKTAFDKNYLVKEDGLLKIGQFENNLPTFTHLKEVKDKDKLGKWFILTNQFKENYLDRKYLPTDRIVLSYITGSHLSEQTDENIYSYVSKLESNKSESILPLGNVTSNSKIEFTIKPIKRYGRSLTRQREVFNRAGGSCGKNCVQLPMNCAWEINSFDNYNDPFEFKSDLIGDGELLDLVINGEIFKLSDLLKDKKIQVTKTDIGTHIAINDISKILEIKDFEENQIAIKLRSIAGSDFFGVKLTEVGGYWQGFGGCPFNTPAVAEKFQTQVSSDSINVEETLAWARQANERGWPYRISKMDSGTYYQEISIGVSSSIENYYN